MDIRIYVIVLSGSFSLLGEGGWVRPEGGSITNVNHYIQHLTVNCSRWLETTSWPGGVGGKRAELVEDGVFLLSELM